MPHDSKTFCSVCIDFSPAIQYDKGYTKSNTKENTVMLTLESFKAARSVLQSVLRPTPLIHSPYVSKNC